MWVWEADSPAPSCNQYWGRAGEGVCVTLLLLLVQVLHDNGVVTLLALSSR